MTIPVFVPAGPPGPVRARICIMGEPGSGKTRLAATFPNPFFLDLENGAGTARPGGVPRLVIPTDAAALKNVRTAVQTLARATLTNGQLVHKPAGTETPLTIGTLVLDSIDALQQPVKMFEVLKGRSKMEREDWDTLLNLLQPLVLEWNALPIHVVVIAHTKRTEGEKGRPGTMDFGVQGALKTQMPRWFDYILHITTGPDGSRALVVQPTIHKGYRFLAKDRHNQLAPVSKGGLIELPGKNGYPDDLIAQTVCGTSAAEAGGSGK